MLALASPASLKGVLSPFDAASALADGLRRSGAEVVEAPVADGGEFTAEVVQRTLGGAWRT
ncbi:MAG TPA: glycerate kinase, partial [Gaiellaceae bacterium]|nr:glycerate kinase [Gaiellaceae bacterium]